MSLRRFGFFLALPLAVGMSVSACGDDDDDIANTGGSGGKAGSAGQTGTGGKATGGSGTSGSSSGGKNTGGTATGGSSTGGSSTGGTTTGGTATGGTATGGSATGGTSGTSGSSGDGGGGNDGGTGMGGDAGAPNAGAGNEAGMGGEAGIAGAGGSDGGPTCPTAPVLYDFATAVTGWEGSVVTSGFGASDGTSTVIQTAGQGHTAAGALQDTLVFTATGVNALTNITLTPTVDWSCFTKLHFWIKVVAASSTDYDKLNTIQIYLNPAGTYDFKGGGAANTTDFTVNLRDGNWREFVLDLPPEKVDVGRIGVLFQATAAVNVTLYLDDISLE